MNMVIYARKVSDSITSPTLGRFDQCLNNMTRDFRASNQSELGKQHICNITEMS